VVVEGGGKVTLDSFDAKHRLQMTFDNVRFGAPFPAVHTGHADFVLGPGPPKAWEKLVPMVAK